MPGRELFFLLLLSLIFYTCGTTKNTEREIIVTEWVGKEILLPQSIQNNNLKVITRINGNCYPCIYRLKEWKPFIEKLKYKYQIPFLIYVVTADSTIFAEINKNEIHFDYPVIFDANDEFRKHNNLPQNSIFHTMLLSDSNKVILIGNPIGNLKLRNLYINQIDNYYESKL